MGDQKLAIIDSLNDLRSMMIRVAADLDYYGGFDPLAKDKAREVTGASKIVEEWIATIMEREKCQN